MVSTVLGLIGAALCVGAYMLLSVERINPKGATYYVLNAIGSLLLLIAMAAEFDGGDAGGVVMEAAWVAISLFGLVKVYLGRNKGSIVPVEKING